MAKWLGFGRSTEFCFHKVLGQVKQWLQSMTVQKLVVVIKDVATGEVMERWQFNVACDKNAAAEGDS